MPVDHYENFPVASLLLPAHLRDAVEAIYAFARSADDIADEGDLPVAERRRQLAEYHQALDALSQGKVPGNEALIPLFSRLAPVIESHRLPFVLFHDLIYAFEQDTRVQRYQGFDDIVQYCRCSANPVGRLLLHLYRANTEENMLLSDHVCTALQLINFWQDVAIDYRKNRIYLPLEEMHHFGVTVAQIAQQCCDAAWRQLMQFEIERTRRMMLHGAPLARRLPGRIGWELRLIVLGGLSILERIEAADYDIFRHRPVLRRTDWIRMIWMALDFSSFEATAPVL